MIKAGAQRIGLFMSGASFSTNREQTPILINQRMSTAGEHIPRRIKPNVI
jgi:hypothetical protein